MTAPRIGPFVLDTRLGAGGMATVWKAHHAGQGVPVALKIVTDAAADPSAFRAEVEAVAGLTHPHVVTIFDTGRLDHAVPDIGEAGMPWMAMELATGGTLRDRGAVPDWSTLRRTLVDLLDALAHAHARGIVHRDLKPANVLVAGPEDARPGIKLSDFGIAQIASTHPARQLSGTPRYMAPEQFQLDGAPMGPWTDLYALGCLIWEAVAGEPPFRGATPAGLAWAHQHADPGPLLPAIAVPRDLEAWLRRLLAKPPTDRYRHAADARDGLHQLGPAPRMAPLPVRPRPTAARTLDAFLLGEPGDDPTEDADPDDLTQPPAPPPLPVRTPAMPERWDAGAPPPPPPLLLGAGLGLWGVRSTPFVGRHRQRDALWSQLHHAVVDRVLSVTLLRGPSGVGKSSLAGWLAERVRELGVAATLHTTHAPGGGPTHGLGGAVRRAASGWRGTDRLDRARFRDWWMRNGLTDRDDLSTLCHIAGFDHDVNGGLDARERDATLARALLALAEHRALLIVSDDVQWGLDTLGFVHHLLDHHPDVRVHLVLTAQEEALADEPEAATLLRALLRKPSVRELAVGPLHHDEARQLVEQLLGVDRGLAARVAERTGGNPMFAVQLVGDWVDRGLLRPSRYGFQLVPDAMASLPDDLHAVWRERLDRVVEADELPALELAAALGEHVQHDEWRTAADIAGVTLPQGLIAKLSRHRLATEDGEAWRFTHGMLRESIARASREHGRWSAMHRAAAAAVAHRHDPDRYDRLTAHLREAGHPTAGARAALEAARRHLVQDNVRTASVRLTEAQALLREAELPQGAGYWAVHDLLRARVLQARDALEEAHELATLVEQRAASAGWSRLEAEAAAQQAEIARVRGDTQGAERAYERARFRYVVLGDGKGQADALRDLSTVAVLRGDLDQALARLTDARERYERLGDHLGIAQCLAGLGDIARVRQDWPHALEAFDASLGLHRALGHRAGVALAKHGLAEVYRLTGRLAEARDTYLEVITLEENIGRDAAVPRLNLALCQLDAHQPVQARAMLEPLEQAWTQQGRDGYVAVVLVALLQCIAEIGDWSAWPAHAERADRLLRVSDLVDLDVAHLAERAGDLARRAGQKGHAADAWNIARRQWFALQDEQGIRRMNDRLGPPKGRPW